MSARSRKADVCSPCRRYIGMRLRADVPATARLSDAHSWRLQCGCGVCAVVISRSVMDLVAGPTGVADFAVDAFTARWTDMAGTFVALDQCGRCDQVSVGLWVRHATPQFLPSQYELLRRTVAAHGHVCRQSISTTTANAARMVRRSLPSPGPCRGHPGSDVHRIGTTHRAAQSRATNQVSRPSRNPAREKASRLASATYPPRHGTRAQSPDQARSRRHQLRFFTHVSDGLPE